MRDDGADDDRSVTEMSHERSGGGEVVANLTDDADGPLAVDGDQRFAAFASGGPVQFVDEPTAGRRSADDDGHRGEARPTRGRLRGSAWTHRPRRG